MAKVYTKVGDKGETVLIGGGKVSKADARIEAYGSIDELNSFVGNARAAAALESTPLDEWLEQLQHWLFDLGSLLAASVEDRQRYSLPPITPEHTLWVEKKIDQMSVGLPELKQFILPAGTELSARLHLARTVARRAERCMIRYSESGSALPDNAIPFINRVSDFLFVAARYANHWAKEGRGQEVYWKKSSPPSE